MVARDGSGGRRLRGGVEPAWSPDGRLLAFTWQDSLCVADADGRDARVVHRGANYGGTRAGGIHADWQPRPAGASIAVSRSSCEHPVARFRTNARPDRRSVASGRRFAFAVSVRNEGPDTGLLSFDYRIAGVFAGLADRAAVGPCGRRPSRRAPEWRDGVYVASGDCLSLRITLRAGEPGRLHLLELFPARGRTLASIVVTGCTILGTAHDDVLRGTPRRDVICGDLGSDVLRGGDGADVVYGGEGTDRLEGGGGRDTLVGGEGGDDLDGGAGDDVLRGRGLGPSDADESEDRDRLRGGPGGDLLDGSEGGDLVRAGAGDDVALARDGFRDSIDCAAGHDRAYVDAVTRTRPDSVARCEFVQRG